MSPLEFVIKTVTVVEQNQFELMILARRALGELGLKHARVDIDTIRRRTRLRKCNIRWHILGTVLVSGTIQLALSIFISFQGHIDNKM